MKISRLWLTRSYSPPRIHVQLTGHNSYPSLGNIPSTYDENIIRLKKFEPTSRLAMLAFLRTRTKAKDQLNNYNQSSTLNNNFILVLIWIYVGMCCNNQSSSVFWYQVSIECKWVRIKTYLYETSGHQLYVQWHNTWDSPHPLLS